MLEAQHEGSSEKRLASLRQEYRADKAQTMHLKAQFENVFDEESSCPSYDVACSMCPGSHDKVCNLAHPGCCKAEDPAFHAQAVIFAKAMTKWTQSQKKSERYSIMLFFEAPHLLNSISHKI